MNTWPECGDIGGKIVNGKWVEVPTKVRDPWWSRLIDTLAYAITAPARIMTASLCPPKSSRRYTIYLTGNRNGIASIGCEFYEVTAEGVKYADEPLDTAKEIGFVPMSQVNCIN